MARQPLTPSPDHFCFRLRLDSIGGPCFSLGKSSGRWDIGPLQTRPRPNLLSPPARLDWPPLLFLWKIIGPVGFEPTTSCTRNKRTTKLCYGPNGLVLYPFRHLPERLNTSKSLVPETTPLPVLPRFLSGLCLPRPASGLRLE